MRDEDAGSRGRARLGVRRRCAASRRGSQGTTAPAHPGGRRLPAAPPRESRRVAAVFVSGLSCPCYRSWRRPGRRFSRLAPTAQVSRHRRTPNRRGAPSPRRRASGGRDRRAAARSAELPSRFRRSRPAAPDRHSHRDCHLDSVSRELLVHSGGIDQLGVQCDQPVGDCAPLVGPHGFCRRGSEGHTQPLVTEQ